jgi:hypothetical protein
MKEYRNLADSYELFKEKYKDKKSLVSKSDYVKIAGLFMKYIMKRIIFHSDTVHLPFKTGILEVVGRKQRISIGENGEIRGLSPNWKKTKELYDRCPECKERRQIVYNMNEHSDGVRYCFNWGLRNIMLKNKSYYVLKMTRENKRNLYKAILNGQEYEIIRKNENN